MSLRLSATASKANRGGLRSKRATRLGGDAGRLLRGLLLRPLRESTDLRLGPSARRKRLVAMLVVAKIVYIGWFYTFGVGLNLGDTASYIDASSAGEYLDRGGIGFAYIATLIYSNPVSRTIVEFVTVYVLCRLVLGMDTDRQAAFAVAFLLFPTMLAFMTVASKELLVFLLVCLAYNARGWIGLPAFVVTVVLKPSFAAIAALPVLRRLPFYPLYFGGLSLGVLATLTFGIWEGFYRSGFNSYSAHFSQGSLTYEEPGLFPFTPLLRAFGIDFPSVEPYGVTIGLLILATNSTICYVLCKKYGIFTGIGMFVIYLVAVAPYSVHNLGSAARYQAPLACALLLNELVGTRRPSNKQVNKC